MPAMAGRAGVALTQGSELAPLCRPRMRSGLVVPSLRAGQNSFATSLALRPACTSSSELLVELQRVRLLGSPYLGLRGFEP